MAYLKENNILWPVAENAFVVCKKLPPNTYTVKASQKGFYIEPIENFSISGKIYGKISKQADRILNTFYDRPFTTGALFSGEKGSGKTMLAKLISQKALNQGISTIVVNSPFRGEDFNTLIQSIDEPAIVIFDEFEKVYTMEEQEEVLTLLDGVYPTKKLFILTCNDKYRINNHMNNRPGRIFYSLDYKGLDVDFIREYCNDNLKNKLYVDQVCRLSSVFDSFNFDMLKALIEEMNRYNESPRQALEMLNAKPYGENQTRYGISVKYFGKEFKEDDLSSPEIRGNPITQEQIVIYVDTEPENPDADTSEFIMTQEHLKKYDPTEGIAVYVLNEDTPNQAVITFKKKQPPVGSYNWMDA